MTPRIREGDKRYPQPDRGVLELWFPIEEESK
jgi:hypothetical protein